MQFTPSTQATPFIPEGANKPSISAQMNSNPFQPSAQFVAGPGLNKFENSNSFPTFTPSTEKDGYFAPAVFQQNGAAKGTTSQSASQLSTQSSLSSGSDSAEEISQLPKEQILFCSHSSACAAPTTKEPLADSNGGNPFAVKFGRANSEFVPEAASRPVCQFTLGASEFTPSAPEFTPSAQAFPQMGAPAFAPQQAQPFMALPYGLGQVCPDLMMMSIDQDGKYKTEICRNWLETAHCRFEEKCRFAHGQEELQEFARASYQEKFKSKNCRTFYQTKQCMYGERCMFRHEHRHFRQLHRHYYTPQLFIYEALYAGTDDESDFVRSYKPTVPSLDIFKAIREASDDEESDEGDDEFLDELERAIGKDLLLSDDEDCAGKDGSSCRHGSGSSSLDTTHDSFDDSVHSRSADKFQSPMRKACADSSDDEQSSMGARSTRRLTGSPASQLAFDYLD